MRKEKTSGPCCQRGKEGKSTWHDPGWLWRGGQPMAAAALLRMDFCVECAAKSLPKKNLGVSILWQQALYLYSMQYADRCGDQ